MPDTTPTIDCFGRGVAVVSVRPQSPLDAISSALDSARTVALESARITGGTPRGACVVDLSEVQEGRDHWASDLWSALIAGGAPAAVVRPRCRKAAAEIAECDAGTVPMFATRAGALLRAVVATRAGR